MELIRDGIEDHEYFAVLRERLDELKQKQPGSELVGRAIKLLEIPEQIAISLTEYSLDPKPLVAHRRKLAIALESVNRALRQ